jgi:hypothetical protein
VGRNTQQELLEEPPKGKAANDLLRAAGRTLKKISTSSRRNEDRTRLPYILIRKVTTTAPFAFFISSSYGLSAREAELRAAVQLFRLSD